MRVLCGSIYSFPLVRYSGLLSAGVLHAFLCLKLYSWCIRGERCTLRPPTPLLSCSLCLKFIFKSQICRCTCFRKWNQFSSVQSLSCVQLFATPWIAARQASLSITNSWNSLKLTSIESVMSSSHLILCHPLLLLPPIPPSIRVFSNESTLPSHEVAKVLEFQL